MNNPRSSIALTLLLACLCSWQAGLAHPDLELQIDRLTQQISEQPGSAELHIKRGDLHRRHEHWPRAGRDFELARDLDPDHPLLDWYEGRLKVEAGQHDEGIRLLTRFLEKQPSHPGAFRVRADAYWQSGQPEASARDFSRAISSTQNPAPALYRSLVIAQYAAGAAQHPAAAASVDRGLEKFPGEISLLGLAVDLALAGVETKRAAAYLARIKPGLLDLPQWKYRRALLACLEGDTGLAASLLVSLGGEDSRAGTWAIPRETVTRLAAEPAYNACLEAASGMLEGLQP